MTRQRSTGRGVRLSVYLLLIVLLLIMPYASMGTTAYTRQYEEANQAYQQEDYTSAIKGYEALIAEGIEHGGVYYNLGNAYFKDGQLGRAILNYERAYRLLPRDEDVEANLLFARSVTEDQISEPPLSIFRRCMFSLRDHFNKRELTWLCFGFYLVICLSAVGYIFAKSSYLRRWLQRMLIVVGICFLIVLWTLAIKAYDVSHHVRAVILSPRAEAFSGPADTYTKIFVLHEGPAVEVHEERGPWSLIKLPDGTGGWMESEAMGRI
jgi:tetratricopeptide (TPR) repeat protein